MKKEIFFCFLISTLFSIALGDADSDDYSKILLIGGSVQNPEIDPTFRAEVTYIDVDSKELGICDNYITGYLLKGAVGDYINGHPTVCGGDGPDNAGKCRRMRSEDGRWEFLNSLMGSYSYGGSGVKISDEKYWILGGRHLYSRLNAPPDETTEIMMDEKWKSGPLLPYKTENHCAVKIGPFTIGIFGGSRTVGNQSESATNRAWIYDDRSNKWTELPRMKMKRKFHSCAYYKNQVYIVGGQDDQDQFLMSVEIYDPMSRTFNSGPDLYAPLAKAQLSVIKHRLILTGGISKDANNIVIELKEDNEWDGWTDMYMKRRIYNHLAIVIPDNAVENCLTDSASYLIKSPMVLYFISFYMAMRGCAMS